MTKKVINREKGRNTPNIVKLGENTNKNPGTFLNVSLVQKEVPPSHQLQDHAHKYQNPF